MNENCKIFCELKAFYFREVVTRAGFMLDQIAGGIIWVKKCLDITKF